jgi:hypothetical protein
LYVWGSLFKRYQYFHGVEKLLNDLRQYAVDVKVRRLQQQSTNSCTGYAVKTLLHLAAGEDPSLITPLTAEEHVVMSR